MNAIRLHTVLALLIFTQIGRADSLDTWTMRYPLPTANALHGVVYGNNQFVAVGAGGVTLTSADGFDWVLRQAPKASALSGVAYGNGLFVAVGDTGTIMTSTNGVNWVQRVSGTSIALLAVAYGNGQFVAVDDTGTVATSADGVNWVQHPSGATTLYGIVYGNGLFVAVGTSWPNALGTIVTSADGVSWVQPQVATLDHMLGSIAFGNGQFVAVSSPDGHNSSILTSADGVNWTVREAALNLSGITYGGDQFVAVGVDSVATSKDGTSWSYGSSGMPYDEHYFADLYGIAYGNGQFVAVGSSWPNGLVTILTSTDGLNWLLRQPKELDFFSDITYGSDKFVAVGGWYNAATSGWEATSATSADGSNWVHNHLGPTISLNHVAYGNGLFVASGYWSNTVSVFDGKILTSTNGINWIPRQSTATNYLSAIAYGNGQFAVVGDTGTILTSADGISWTQRQSGTQIRLSAITYGNEQFVAAGSYRVGPYSYTNVSLVSTDGVNWLQDQDTSHRAIGGIVYGIAYGSSQFVEVGVWTSQTSGAMIQNSPDGLNYSPDGLNLILSGESLWESFLSSITYASGYFVAVGGGHYHSLGRWGGFRPLLVLTSADGVTWVQRPQPGTQIAPAAIAYGNGYFVAVGSGGTILQSDSVITLALTPNAGTGLLSLSLEGPSGLAYAIESSTDLISWRNLTNITSVQSSTVIFEALPAASERVFYRAVAPSP